MKTKLLSQEQEEEGALGGGLANRTVLISQ